MFWDARREAPRLQAEQLEELGPAQLEQRELQEGHRRLGVSVYVPIGQFVVHEVLTMFLTVIFGIIKILTGHCVHDLILAASQVKQEL